MQPDQGFVEVLLAGYFLLPARLFAVLLVLEQNTHGWFLVCPRLFPAVYSVVVVLPGASLPRVLRFPAREDFVEIVQYHL